MFIFMKNDFYLLEGFLSDFLGGFLSGLADGLSGDDDDDE